MKQFRWPILLFIVCSIGGAYLSGVLLKMHVQGKSGTGLLARACGGEGGGCDEVINSRWGVFPPAPEEAETSPEDIGPALPDDSPSEDDTATAGEASSGGIPVAALGLFYYTLLAAWFVVIGQPSWKRRWMHTAIISICAIGCLGSVWFIIVMGFFIETWCPLCLSSHVCNFFLLASVFFFRPQPPAVESEDDRAEPGPRLLLVATLLAAAVCVAEWQGFRALGIEVRSAELEEVAGILEEFKSNAKQLEEMYFLQPKENLGIEDHHPMINAKKGSRQTLTYFSDIECPSCAKYDMFIFEKIKPLYNGHLRIVFKHLPLESLHKNAFKAATALEAAHLQGKFWEAHDYLIERRHRLRNLKYSKMATDLGLDPIQLVTDMNSRKVRQRVQDDMKVANRLGITSTPTVFLNDRMVNKLTRKRLSFWELRAQGLKEVYDKSPGMEW